MISPAVPTGTVFEPTYRKKLQTMAVCGITESECDMGKYVDGFLICVPRKNLAAYLKLSRKAGKIWREYGALEYRECVGEDLAVKEVVRFPKVARAKPGEVVFFSWIVYKSRAHRDRVQAKVMEDPRLTEFMDPKKIPFDAKRMVYGGFDLVVDI